jgi:hypothetical protein
LHWLKTPPDLGMIRGCPVILDVCQEWYVMNAVAQKSGNSETKSKPGKSSQPKQVASAGGTPEKQAAKSKKSISAGSNSTGKKPAGKKKTAGKKAAGRKKTTTRPKSTTRRTGASGEKAAAATGSAGLASLPIDPPPVTFPDAAAVADDPRSLSWMAQQAVSALNAVKAHQAEKGKAIMARAEKDTTEHEPADPGKQTGKPAQTTGAVEPGDAGQLQIEGSAESAAGSSGKENRDDTGTQQEAEKQPGGPQQADNPAPSGIADSPVPKPAAVPASGVGAVADSPPLRTAVKRRYPIRLLAVIAIAIVVALWLYFGAGDEAVRVTNQPEQEIAGKPVLEPAGQSASVPADKPAWQPATAPAQFPEPVPASRLRSTDTAEPVAASELTGVTAQETGQPVAGTIETPARETPARETPARETNPGSTDSAPVQPVTPPGRRAPGYGYYPPQPSWQPPTYYRPGYSRPPSR